MAKQCHPDDDFMFGKDSSVYEFRNIRTFKNKKTAPPRSLSERSEQLYLSASRVYARNDSAHHSGDPYGYMDEPLSNLDAKLRIHMRTEIRRIQKALGTTCLYVTHDQSEALTVSDRIVVMSRGKVEQIGTPLEIYGKPESDFWKFEKIKSKIKSICKIQTTGTQQVPVNFIDQFFKILFPSFCTYCSIIFLTASCNFPQSRFCIRRRECDRSSPDAKDTTTPYGEVLRRTKLYAASRVRF